MDSHQSATEGSFEMNRDNNQNQGSSMSSTDEESGEGLMQELNPLKLGNILEKVFSFLDDASIKNARQVNKLWSVEGAKSLITKCFVEIPWPLQIKRLDSPEIKKFKEFLALKSSDRSMIPNIIIGAAVDLAVWEKLGVLGPQVKSVKLKHINYEAKLLQKLLDLLPNLSYLNLKNLVIFNKCDESHNEEIKSFCGSVLSRVKKNGTPFTFSRITLKAFHENHLTNFEKLANCTNIKMEELILDFNPSDLNSIPDWQLRLVKIVNKLLSTNQNALKRLTVFCCQSFWSLLEFPCMTKLIHLNLDFRPVDDEELSLCKFPPSFRFSEKVPNLQEIYTFYQASTLLPLVPQGFFQHVFQNTGPAPSVKLVNCLWNDTVSSAEILFNLFPNVEDLYVRVDECRPWWWGCLWTFGTNLKNLHLDVHFNDDCEQYDWDSIFTGFTRQTVNEIRDDPDLAPFTWEKVEALRINPSILNLKELENITIHLAVKNSYGTYHILPKRMFTVVEKYGLRLLPKKPKITIFVEGGNYTLEVAMRALKEVSQLPNVRVEKYGSGY